MKIALVPPCSILLHVIFLLEEEIENLIIPVKCPVYSSQRVKTEFLTLRAPRVLVPTPSTKGGGVEKNPQ